jgi:hypothetical protein
MAGDAKEEEEEFVSEVGPLKVDWPRTVGYYGAIGLAVAFDVIAPPLALFIAAVPLLKLLKRENASKVERLVAAVFEGAGKPVGGDADSVVRPKWVDEKEERDEREHVAALAQSSMQSS